SDVCSSDYLAGGDLDLPVAAGPDQLGEGRVGIVVHLDGAQVGPLDQRHAADGDGDHPRLPLRDVDVYEPRKLLDQEVALVKEIVGGVAGDDHLADLGVKGGDLLGEGVDPHHARPDLAVEVLSQGVKLGVGVAHRLGE